MSELEPNRLLCPLCDREIWNSDEYDLSYKPSDLGYCSNCDDAVPMVSP